MMDNKRQSVIILPYRDSVIFITLHTCTYSSVLVLVVARSFSLSLPSSSFSCLHPLVAMLFFSSSDSADDYHSHKSIVWLRQRTIRSPPLATALSIARWIVISCPVRNTSNRVQGGGGGWSVASINRLSRGAVSAPTINMYIL